LPKILCTISSQLIRIFSATSIIIVVLCTISSELIRIFSAASIFIDVLAISDKHSLSVKYFPKKVYPNNIKAMMDWPIPKTLKNLRGFLGLTGYYRKFVQNYGRIATHLTTLTKKDSFSWTLEVTKDFEQFKYVMCKPSILTTLDFTKTFIVECDALRNGIGVVLMQEGRPLAFES
jgi:hypothetical protein